jgi:hypothetical protein
MDDPFIDLNGFDAARLAWVLEGDPNADHC